MGAGQWLDVCLRNAALLLAACDDLGIDRAVVLDALPPGTPQDPQELNRAWVTLADFNAVMDAWVDAAGHPAHLLECGASMAAVEYGSDAIKRLLLKGPVRYLTNPSLAIEPALATFAKWNSNKDLRALYGGRRPGVELLRMDYVRGPAGQPPRDPADDVLSVLYWIRGVWQQIAPQWAGQAPVGEVRYLRLEADVFSVIDKVLPGSRRELLDGVLLVDGTAIGRVVWLVPDDELEGEYLGAWVDLPPAPGDASGATPAVRIERSLLTVSTRTRESLPLLREGEIYSHPEHRLAGTIAELRWRTSWTTQWFKRWFHTAREDFGRTLQAEVEHAVSEQRVATYERRLELADEYLRRRFPTKAIAGAVLDARYTPQRLITSVLLLDIVKFTVASWTLQSHEMAARIRRFSARMIAIAEREGGWFYKFTGDGGIFVWTDWSGERDEASMRRAAGGAARAALSMRRIPETEFGWQLRIGLNSDEITWYVLEEGFSFEGTGRGIDFAARMEKAADDGEIRASDPFAQLLDPAHRRGPIPATIKHGASVDTWRVVDPSAPGETPNAERGEPASRTSPQGPPDTPSGPPELS